MRQLKLCLFLFLTLSVPAGVLALPDSVDLQEAHYQFLKEELKNARTFYTEERKAHQEFLQWYYKLTIGGASGVIAVFLFLVTFYGVKTRKDLREEIKALKDEALEKTEKELSRARADLNEGIISKFTAEKESYEGYIQGWVKWVEQQFDVEHGTYLMISDPVKLTKMEEEGEEVTFLKEAFRDISFISSDKDLGHLKLDGVDVLLYRSNVNDKGIDLFLENTLIPKLKAHTEKIPLVFYAKGGGEFYKGTTGTALNDYLLYQPANNIGTLIDNTASAFRTSRLLRKNKSTPKA